MNTMIKQLSTSIGALCLANIGHASDAIGPGDSDSRWVVGGSASTMNNVYVGEDTEGYILPYVEFNGETFWVKNGTFNVSFGQWDSLSGGVTAKLDGGFLSNDDNYEDNEKLAGLEERGYSADGGIYLYHTTDRGRLKLALYTDVGSEHDGHEAIVKYTFDLKAGAWSINPMIGAQWLSDNKVNYFYGVSDAESTPLDTFHAVPTYVREAYKGGAAVNYFAGVRGRYEITDNWDVNLNAGVTRLDSDVTDSSVVEDDYSYCASASFRYNF